MYFDTHTHIDDERFDDDREALIAALRQNGVMPILDVGADMDGCKRLLSIAETNDFIYAAVGLHPDAAQHMTEADLEDIRRMAAHPKVKAIGEIGLDYHWPDSTDKPRQQYWFDRQMALAQQLNLPVIIHSRDATADTLAILRRYPKMRGVMHCFSGSVETMKEVVALGYHIALGGVVTFKNAKTAKEVAAAVPTDRLLIETDCPYLTPEPYRGQTNSPLYVPLVAAEIARLRGMKEADIARITYENGKKLFSIE